MTEQWGLREDAAPVSLREEPACLYSVTPDSPTRSRLHHSIHGGLGDIELSTESELEIQARWFSGEFGRVFPLVGGGSAEVLQFGVWNRESGPDFKDAAVSINGGPPVRGCIELDPDVRDWERHGHAVNPAYGAVVLHCFWRKGHAEAFTRTHRGRAVPQVFLDLSQRVPKPQGLIPCARAGRCAPVIHSLSGPETEALLLEAAKRRLYRKAERFAQTERAHCESVALYQKVAETLGYKANKLPFQLLAQRLPLSDWRRHPKVFESVLFGVSGFLPSTNLRLSKDPLITETYLRALWDQWWPWRTELLNLTIPEKYWKFSGVRPLNHPQRRVAALSVLAENWRTAHKVLQTGDFAQINRFFTALAHPYWSYHYTLMSAPSPKRLALIGSERVAGILANVMMPLAFARGLRHFEKLREIPAFGFNHSLERAARRFFGQEAKAVPLLRKALFQQGALEIYGEFCGQDTSDCLHCRFPEQVKALSKTAP